MDKRVILAVAGSGKSSLIISSLDVNKKTLLITYTVENYLTLRRKVAGRFGYVPENVVIYTYFQFLYQFCVRPLLGFGLGIKGIDWTEIPRPKTAKSSVAHYFTKGRRLYHNRASKILIETDSMSEVCQRIEKYFDVICIDEVQDFAANDFNFMLSLCQAKVEVLLVGDFYQHTFDTSRDGSTRKNLHKDYELYQKEFEKVGLKIDLDTLVKSYRCSPQICSFVSDNLGISIESHHANGAKIQFVRDGDAATKLFDDANRIKLFYESHAKYDCASNNWGKSKGRDDYQDVCVVLNRNTLKLFYAGKLDELNPTSKNKLYVALTRARGVAYLVPHTFYDHLKNA